MLYRDYKTGVGLRPKHYHLFEEALPKGIHWVEVISENYMLWENHRNDRPLKNLLRIRPHAPVALHGVSLSIGSADSLNKNYLKCLKSLIKDVEPIMVSDHLCWTGLNRLNSHDLLPIPYNGTTLKHVKERVDQVQNFLGRTILLENASSYVEFAHSEIPEWDFLVELSRKSGCGILLDINNVYVSARNHGFNPMTYLRAIPPALVGQVHLAGHLDKGDHIVDTHDRQVCDDVWKLFQWWVNNNGLQSTMIEWDSKIPEWSVIHSEVSKVERIRKRSLEQRRPNNIRSNREAEWNVSL